jgi:hypothetical protein
LGTYDIETTGNSSMLHNPAKFFFFLKKQKRAALLKAARFLSNTSFYIITNSFSD